MTPRVLIVDDDPLIRELLQAYLSQEGYDVHCAATAEQAESFLGQHTVDLLMLDIRLPGKDGLTLTRELRVRSEVGIILITGRNDDIDRIVGLECGADDYVIKPIKPPVLLARLRALQRRQVPDSGVVSSLEFGNLIIDRSCREVRLAGELIELTTMEFELLWLLASAAGNILSRDDILNRMRGIAFDGLNRSVDVYISKLRNKLKDNPREPVCIKTVWGKGYLFSRSEWEC